MTLSLRISFPLLLILILFSFVRESSQGKKVNCRKYVFAPVCRGVAAKRALPQMDLDFSAPSSFGRRLARDSPGGSILVDPRGGHRQQWRDRDKDEERGLLGVLLQRIDEDDYDVGLLKK